MTGSLRPLFRRRHHIGLGCFTSFNLIPTLTAEENVSLGRLLLDGKRESDVRPKVRGWGMESLGGLPAADSSPECDDGRGAARVAIAPAAPVTGPGGAAWPTNTGNFYSSTARSVCDFSGTMSKPAYKTNRDGHARTAGGGYCSGLGSAK